MSVCAGTACVFAGSMKVRDAFVAEVEAAGLQDEVEVRISGCHGLCSQGPLAVVSDGATYYPKLKVKDVPRVVTEHLVGGEPVLELVLLGQREEIDVHGRRGAALRRGTCARFLARSLRLGVSARDNCRHLPRLSD